MQYGLGKNPNRIEADIRWQDAHRPGDHGTRGALNLGRDYPFGSYVYTPPQSAWDRAERMKRLQLATALVIGVVALGYGCAFVLRLVH
jgi:hypothetical protein